jgi:hypothetical protein
MYTNTQKFTNAQYMGSEGNNISIRCDIDGVTKFVPLDPENDAYTYIMYLVETGELTILPAE